MTVKTNNTAETKKLGAELAKKFAHGGVVCLYGNLGAGKTTLVQGIARGLGIKKHIVSPTFVLVRRYQLPTTNYRLPSTDYRLPTINYLWHVDLYRLQNIQEAKDIAIEEMMADTNNIVLVEWPEKIETLLPKKHWKIKIESIGERERSIFYETIH